MPTPRASDGRGPGRHGDGGVDLRTTVAGLPGELGQLDERRWGGYAAAVARWELLLGRPVPEPTQTGTNGKPVLAPPFVEWLMGLEPGWVTGLGLPRTAALRVLGNGVVPQQAAVALRLLLCPHRWVVTARAATPPSEIRPPRPTDTDGASQSASTSTPLRQRLRQARQPQTIKELFYE